MSRIRSIKPDMAQSEALASIPRATLYTWVMLWPQCDDFGHHRADPRLVLAAVYPLRDDVDAATVAAELDELEAAGRICRYTGCDGKAYLHILGWEEHQRVDNAAKVWHPPCSKHEPERRCRQHNSGCPGSTEFAATRRESPRVAARTSEDGPRKTDLGRRTSDLGDIVPNGTHPTAAQPGVLMAAQSVAQQVFDAWKARGGLNGRTVFTKDRQRKVDARLREYPPEDVIDAAAGIWRSEWHVEHGQTDLALAMRDAGHLERFRDIERGARSGADRGMRSPSQEWSSQANRDLEQAMERLRREREAKGGGYDGG